MKYEITRYHIGDEIKINELFHEAFGGRSLDIVQWLNNNESNPLAKYCLANMWDGDTLVAHVILWPYRAVYDDEMITAATSGTVMASIKYPGASIPLLRWAAKNYSDFFVIGFPNNNSFPIAIKALKHNYIGDIDFWWNSLSDQPALFTIEGQEIRVVELDTPSEQCDFTESCKKYKYSAIRDKSYIMWRFTERKNSGYHYCECYAGEKLIGYYVYNIYHAHDDGIDELQGQVVDFMAVDTKSFSQVIRNAEKLLLQQDIHKIKMWCTSRAYQKELKEMGYSYGMRPFHVELWNGKLALNEIYLTMADSDVF